MYLLFISGSYRGSFNLMELVEYLDYIDYFETTVEKYSFYNTRPKILNELATWNIGRGTYLDASHKYRVVKSAS